MKAFLSSLVMLAVCGVTAWSSSTSPAEQIQLVISRQQDSWNRGNLEDFMAGYWNSPDLTFFSGGHESKGWQAALDRYKKSYQGTGHEMGKLEFANLRIEMLGRDRKSTRLNSSHANISYAV